MRTPGESLCDVGIREEEEEASLAAGPSLASSSSSSFSCPRVRARATKTSKEAKLICPPLCQVGQRRRQRGQPGQRGVPDIGQSRGSAGRRGDTFCAARERRKGEEEEVKGFHHVQCCHPRSASNPPFSLSPHSLLSSPLRGQHEGRRRRRHRQHQLLQQHQQHPSKEERGEVQRQCLDRQ